MTLRPLAACAVVLGLALAGAPRRAFAGSVTDEVTVGRTFAQGTKFYGDRLAALFEPSERLSLRTAASVMRYEPVRRSGGETVLQLSAGGTLQLSDAWAVGLDVNGAPPATASSAPRATLDDGSGTPTPVTLDVKTRTSSFGGSATVEYARGTDTDHETVVDATLGATAYDVTNRIAGARSTTGAPLGSASCGATGCAPDVARSLDRDTVALAQLRASVGLTQTLRDATDVDVVATYYGYTDDPTQVGILSVGTFGRAAVAGGIPTLPLRWSARAAVLHRLGAWGVGGSLQHGQFIDREGYGDIGGLRAEWRFAAAWKGWLSAYAERDAGPALAATWTAWCGAGARVRF